MKILRSREYAGSRHILNPDREYVPASRTDVAATIKRVLAEQAQTAKQPKVRRIR